MASVGVLDAKRGKPFAVPRPTSVEIHDPTLWQGGRLSLGGGAATHGVPTTRAGVRSGWVGSDETR